MENAVTLGPSEIADGHPFTDPIHTADDLAAIRLMAAGLHGALRALAPGPWPVALTLPEVGGNPHRTVITDDRPLRAARDLAFVGFFAQRRAGLDFAPLDALDDELIVEFPSHPGIISYSSLRLPDRNWANLICVDPPDAREDWRTSAKHAYAAREIAPAYYTVVRLHNGWFPGGLTFAHTPVIVRTAYYDFQHHTPWRAERRWDERR